MMMMMMERLERIETDLVRFIYPFHSVNIQVPHEILTMMETNEAGHLHKITTSSENSISNLMRMACKSG